jgi:5-methylcytosine-specific restriction endonuclease McrA
MCDGQSFDKETIEAVWRKAPPEGHYAGFRKDACNASIHVSAYGTTDQWGWEIDHIKPISAGGTDALDNLQPLHWENNRHKADDWPHWECKIVS